MTIHDPKSETIRRIHEMVEKDAEFFSHLRSRWQDEHDFEDKAEYIAAIAKRLPPGFTLLRTYLSPFFFEFTVDSAPDSVFRLRASRMCVSWERIS